MKLYLDCDDTILNSSECIIEILNKKNGTNKTIGDLKDFNYRSIDKTLTSSDVLRLFEVDEFWKNVKYNADFLKCNSFLRDNFDIEIVSCGTECNLVKKKEFLKPLGYKFNGIFIDENLELCKKCINMQDGIQIDDNMRSMENTNAAIKILLKNGHDFSWNDPKPNIDNLYIVQNWEEIYQILGFFKKNPDFICKVY